MNGERRVCHLIDYSLRPLTSSMEISNHGITQKMEKQLLISLSQVLRQIQTWTNELDSNSNDVMEVKALAFNGKCSSESESHCEDPDCLTKIFDDMVFVLSVDNRFVQHLAGNILVAITTYLVASESDWSQFVKSLCICLESMISNALLHTPDRSQCLDHDTPHVVTALQPKLKRVNWSSLACVVRVLRAILKRMKQDMDGDELLIYLDLMCACLANVPWDAMDQNWNSIRLFTDSLEGKAGQLETRSVFQGALVQLFCSLVNLSDEGPDKSFNEHPVICQIRNAVPKLLGWCLGHGNQNNARLFEYFRHKTLVLMIRLSSQIVLEDSLLVFWLNLIHEYFEDLLLLPMTQTDQEDILEGSPFIPSFRNTHKREAPSRHLQRLVVLLFLRCLFSLIGPTDRRSKHCADDSDLKCSCVKKGLSELRWWVQIHFPSEVFGASDCYFEKCTCFSVSFLRLFIQEDDILFELLLLLFCVPLESKQPVVQDIYAFQEMNDDILVHVSNILNPIQLFHLFLSELHYDHQVLLDYLISKDTGAPSAEYFLRSLRIICDSWTKFVEFSLEGEVADVGGRNRPSSKKRKVLGDGLDIWARVGSSTVRGDNTPSSLGIHHQEAILHCNAYSNNHGLTFDKAKDCLLLLKKTLQNLHQKELFPYDPKVLLRRLGRFQELCLRQ